MKFSDGERLTIVMLSEIMQALKIEREIDPGLVKRLVCGGDDWAIKRKYPGIFSEDAPEEEHISETSRLLMMWRVIEEKLGELSGREADEAKGWPHTEFLGFDANHDPHYRVAQTLIQDLDDFEYFSGRPLNSHSQASLPNYRLMHEKFRLHRETDDTASLPFPVLKYICS
ncbi:YfbU family protein [Cereibacter changlensis]|uniref:YfbU family protein n=1 Tax=Cereibacter changlensis TaxID=402884 RepID=UPI0040341564